MLTNAWFAKRNSVSKPDSRSEFYQINVIREAKSFEQKLIRETIFINKCMIRELWWCLFCLRGKGGSSCQDPNARLVSMTFIECAASSSPAPAQPAPAEATSAAAFAAPARNRPPPSTGQWLPATLRPHGEAQFPAPQLM